MGFPSLHENILERLNDALSSLLRDEERGKRARSVAEEEARMNAIREVQGQISRLLEEHLEIATTPGMELTERVKHQESEIAALKREIETARTALIQERQRTADACDAAARKDAKIEELQKENNSLEMKLAFLSVKENGGRSTPIRGRR